MGLEEAKEVCRDRKVWRRMTDRIVCLIKFGPRHTFDAVQKGVWRPRWDYASAVGSCRGCLGVTGPHFEVYAIIRAKLRLRTDDMRLWLMVGEVGQWH